MWLSGGDDRLRLLCIACLLRSAVNLLMLHGTNRLCGVWCPVWRIAAAAVLEALISGISLFLAHPAGVMVRTIGGLAAYWTVFRTAWKQWGACTMLMFAVTAAAAAMERGQMIPVVLAALGVWLLSLLLSEDRNSVCVEIGGLRLRALRDTGNTLRDPITGEQVLIVGCAAAEALTGLSAVQLRDPITTLCRQPIAGLRLIPYRAVGNADGILLAKRFPRIKIGGRAFSGLVAFAPEGLEGSGYQALTGGYV